jgi:hypothetical protein
VDFGSLVLMLWAMLSGLGAFLTPFVAIWRLLSA